MMLSMPTDHSTLEAALIGCQYRLDQITKAMADIRAKLDGKANPRASVPPEDTKRRKSISAAGRKRMAAAQKKRWAEHRKKGAS